MLWFHVPNGGKRNGREAGRLKRMGVRPGVADLLFFWGRDKGAIELKAGKNKQTDTQEAFQAEWEALGGKYRVCRDFESVVATLCEWGVVA